MRRSALILISSCAIGLVGALFLDAMDWAGQAFSAHPALLLVLPIGGAVSNLLYAKINPAADGGTSAALMASEDGQSPVAPSSAPLIFLSTVLTHLGGGSAGREGTALQMGAGVTALFGNLLNCQSATGGLPTRCGVAAGFSAVFGTPAAATAFVLERSSSRLSLAPVIWVLISACLANRIAGICGAQHSTTFAPQVGLPSVPDLLELITLSVACGVTTGTFQRILAYLASKRAQTRSVWLAPILASIAIALLISLIPNGWDFCGLGAVSYVPDSVSIQSMLQTGFAPRFAWFWKGVFTMVTLGAGLRGGEVTPLFFIGAALGLHLAATMNAPAGMGAATGLCLMFAAGLQAPVTASVMALELFGWEASLAVAVSAKLSAVLAKKIVT